MKTFQNIVMVDLESEIQNYGHLMAMPRFGLSVIGSIVSQAGYPVKIFSDVYGPVTVEKILANQPDIVMFNGIKTVFYRVKKYAQAIKEANPNVIIMIGGEEVTLNPENATSFADYIVLNEGDETILKLLHALEQGEDLTQMKGIWYKEKEIWKKNEGAPRVLHINYQLNPSIYQGIQDIRKPFLTKISEIVAPGRMLYFPLQSSRGCDRVCSFCTWLKLFGGSGYMERSVENVVQDIQKVIQISGIRNFMMVDDLFGKRKEYATSLAQKIIEQFPKKSQRPEFIVLMRADLFQEDGYSDEELKLLRMAGFKDISMGLESVNEETLKFINKGLTVDEYVYAINKLKKHNIRVCGTFGVGGGEDNKDDIKRIVKFAKMMKLYRIHLYSYSIFPGTPSAIRNGHLMIPHVDPKYMNGHGAIIYPKRMLPSELQEGLLDAMEQFYSWMNIEGAFYRLQLKRVRQSLKPHLAELKTLEVKLIDRQIYQKNTTSSHWELNEQKLRESEFVGKSVGLDSLVTKKNKTSDKDSFAFSGAGNPHP